MHKAKVDLKYFLNATTLTFIPLTEDENRSSISRVTRICCPLVTYRIVSERADDAVEPSVPAVQRGHVSGHARVKLGPRRVAVPEEWRWLGNVTGLVRGDADRCPSAIRWEDEK